MSDLIWHTEKKKVKDLKFFKGNPRTMSEKQAEDLLTSIKKFNLVEIPVCNTDNVILAGNMRVEALKKLKRENELIEVRVPNRKLNEDEAKEYLIRSNRNTGSWDNNLLINFDNELLLNWGFQKFELPDFDYNQEIDKEAEDEDENIARKMIKVCLNIPIKVWLTQKEEIKKEISSKIEDYGITLVWPN